MANLAGFMPIPAPGTIYGGDWSQPYSGIMDTLLQAQQAGQQRAWDQSLSGPSFNRRFGGMLPPSLNMPSAPVQQQADPQTLAALQGALAQAAQATGQFMPDAVTRQTGVPYAGPMIDASGGPLRGQKWYDEYLTLAQNGGDLPMVQGHAGAMPAETQVGIDKRRAERLGGLVPMAERRQNVQNKALYAREQNAVDSGNMSPNQQYFNELARLQGALGGQGGGDIVNGAIFGPQAMVDMAAIRQREQEAQMKRDMLNDPVVAWSNALQSNPNVLLADIQGQMKDPQGFANSQALAAAPDFQSFAEFVIAHGGSRDTAKQQWIALGKPDPDAPSWLGKFFGFGPEMPPHPAYTTPEKAGGAYPIPYG